MFSLHNSKTNFVIMTIESIHNSDIEMKQVNKEQKYDNKSACLLQRELHQIWKLHHLIKSYKVHQNILQN